MQILAESNPDEFTVSLEAIRREIGRRMKCAPPSKSTVKRHLEDMGIFSKGVRRWAYRHNAGRDE